MAQQPPQTFQQQALSGLVMIAVPALSVMVFTRHSIGIRQISLFRQIAASAFLLIFSGYSRLNLAFSSRLPSDDSFTVMLAFVIAMLAAGSLQKRAYKKRLAEGDLWYSYSMGISRLTPLLPRHEEWVRRIVEPALVIFIGLMVMNNLSYLLGFWLFMGGVGISLWETYAFEQQFNRILDTVDQECISAAEKSEAEEIKAAQKQYTTQTERKSIMETAGIPTGIAPDIEIQIQKRRNRRQPTEDMA